MANWADFRFFVCQFCGKEVALCPHCDRDQLRFRFFVCQLCDEEVAICSHCDRGQLYCSKRCSKQARRESVKESGRQYQKTEKGKAKHAARQAMYELRQAANPLRQTNPQRPGQANPLCQVLANPLRQIVYQLEQPSSGCSEEDDASGYPNADRPVHTIWEDAGDDFGGAFSRRAPELWAQMSIRCCLCGARCLPRPP